MIAKILSKVEIGSEGHYVTSKEILEARMNVMNEKKRIGAYRSI